MRPAPTTQTAQPALTFPSRIICFRLLISFFSSKLAASSFWAGGERVGGGRDHHGGCHLQGSTLGPRGRAPSLTLTISHSLRTTLTCVRICRTWASSTGNSSSFFSVGTGRGLGLRGGREGQAPQRERFQPCSFPCSRAHKAIQSCQIKIRLARTRYRLLSLSGC